jgi:uncharacterized membrane protein
MMSKTFSYTFLLISMVVISFPINAQSEFNFGCDFEDIDTSLAIKALFPDHRGSLPTSASLKHLAPTPGNQGRLNSCAAWSSAYAGLTIIRGVENQSKQTPSDPLHLYNRVQTALNRPPCVKGSTISAALDVLKSSGCLSVGEYPKSCGSEPIQQTFPTNLYDYQLIEVSVTAFKKALINQQPIVAAFKAYNNTGWEKKENLVNGVWNGKFNPDTISGHGMCIVGFDDNKGGGAFEVMNSWGTQWGDGGFFWISYKDLVNNIKYAYTLLPHPTDPNALNASFATKQLEIHNDCFDPLYVAIGLKMDNDWLTKGWYIVQPFEKSSIDVSQRTNNDILWVATNDKKNIFWDNPESEYKLCIDTTQSFEFMELNCQAQSGFHQIVPKNTQNTQVFHVGCPSITGRNSEVTYLPDFYSAEIDPRSKEEANKNWISAYGLFDLYSNKLIQPTMDDNGELQYKVWLTNGVTAPENKTLSAAALENENRLKFYSQESAVNYINWLQQ